MIGRRIVLLTGAAILAGVADATAQHFTFRVPVQLHSVLVATTAAGPKAPKVGCIVWDQGGAYVGEGKQAVPVDANGEYTGTVVVSFDAFAGKDPATATGWTCFLWRHDPLVASNDQYIASGDTCQSPECMSKTGAPQVLSVQGTIP